MAGFFVHPGAVEPYERLTPARVTELGGNADVTARALAYYSRLARRAGHVLEYGAGRGTLTWAMAHSGARVTAVELSNSLVQALTAEAATLPRSIARQVKVQQGDMRTLRLRRRFPLVVAPMNTFLHLYNRRDVEAFLEGVRHHLAEDGRFVFDVVLPRPEELTQGYDPVAQIQSRQLGSGVQLAQRQYFPRELEMLLWYNGFRRLRLRADFTGQKPDAATQVLVVTASR